ncbi:MAG: ABC transporter substrate-binding protein, partial [Bdellovibrionota bacterium]
MPKQILDCLKQHNETAQEETPLYAQGFSIYKGQRFSFIEIKERYGLKGQAEIIFISSMNLSCSNVKVIHPPFKKVLSLSTTFIPLFDLGKNKNFLFGISGKSFINSAWAMENLKKGQIKDIGYPPNLETVANLAPDLILLYPLAEQEFSLAEKFKALKLNYVSFAEYLEPHPLGRAEWVKVFCQILECGVDIQAEFAKIANDYERTKASAQKSRSKPKVIMGSFWGGDWHSPGGDSFLAKLVGDAGGEYTFSTPKTAQTKVMDFEFVYSIFSSIDIWLPHASMRDLTTLQQEDARYKMLKKFNIKIFNYDKIRSENGGIDFWE